MSDYDVIVIGAGPAGSVAAAGLANQGRRVLMLEREQFPRFVIGESLLPRTNEILSKVGLLEAVENAGFMRKDGAVFYRGDEREQFNFRETSAPGWEYTYQVPRADFDQVLAEAAADKGTELRYRSQVEAVDFKSDGVTLSIRDLQSGRVTKETADFVIDGSGYGRVLVRLLGLGKASSLSARTALFSHVRNDHRPTGSDEGYIWIVTTPEDAWIWVIPFSNGLTSVGIVADPEFFTALKGSDDEILRHVLLSQPALKARLADMELAWAPKKIEGYSAGVKQLFGERYILTGNASEFLDPVFSSGVTVAVESAYRAQDVVGRWLDGEEVDFQKEYADYVMSGVDCFRAYVNNWYSGDLHRIFFSPVKAKGIKKKICSVLAGYAWDRNNPYAANAASSLLSTVAMISR